MASKSFNTQVQKVKTLTDDSSNLSNSLASAGDFQEKQGNSNQENSNIGPYLYSLPPNDDNRSKNSEIHQQNTQFPSKADTEVAKNSSNDRQHDLSDVSVPTQTNHDSEHHQDSDTHHKSGEDQSSSDDNDDGTVGQTAGDTVAPVLLSEGSLDNRNDVLLFQDLQVGFNENIQLGAGVIELHKASDGSLIEAFKNGAGSVGGSLSISKAQLVINPFADLVTDTHYYLTFSDSVIRDLAGNNFRGIANPDRLDFTTVKPDTQAPGLLPLDPQSTQNVSGGIVLTFNENVKLASGAIELHKTSDHSLVDTFSNGISAHGLTAYPSGSKININFTQEEILPQTQYYVTIGNNAVTDTAGNVFSGVSDPSLLSFTTVGPDVTAPVFSNITFQNPSSVASDLSLNFNENVQLGSGEIVLHKASDGSVVETYTNGIGSAGGNANSGSKTSVTINPGADLSLDTPYYLTISGGAITDQSGNAFAGASNPSAFTFTSPGPDRQAPSFTGTYAYPGQDGKLSTTVITFSFDEEVKLGVGDIVLHNADGSVVETFSRGVGSADGYITGMYSSFNLITYAKLTAGSDYYLTIGDNAVTDKAGNTFAGVSDATTARFTQQPSFNPADQSLTFNSAGSLDNQIGVLVSTDINLSFNHEVKLGTGVIKLHNADDGSIVESFSNGIGSAGGSVTVSKSNIVVNPAADLAPATQYYVTVDNGLISDTNGEVFKGFNDTDTLNFFTAGVDRLAPQLMNSYPMDNQVNTVLDQPINLYFNEQVKLGNGTIELHKASDNSLVESFTQGTGSTGGNATVSYYGINIDPAADLAPETQYYLTVSDTAIIDLSGNAFAGISDPATLNFTTIPPDRQGPVLYNSMPTTNFPIANDLILNFDESIKLGSGDIVLHKASDGSVVETFTNGIGSMGGSVSVDNSTSSKSGPGHSVIINPLADLTPETQYYLTTTQNAITDTTGNAFAGFSNPNEFTFKTAPLGPVLTYISLQNTSLASDLVVNFDRSVQLGAGEMVLHKVSDGSVIETFTNGVGSAGGSVNASDSSITINPNADLAPNTQYYLTIAKGAVADSAGVAFAGLSDPTLFNISTPPLDTTAPELVYSTPLDNQTHIGINADFSLNFNESIQIGEGSIELHKVSDHSLVEAFVKGVGSAGGAASLSSWYGDSNLVVNPGNDLLLGTQYYLTVSGDALTDLSGNAYSGFLDPDSFNFKTTSDPDAAYTLPEQPPIPIDYVGVQVGSTVMF